MFVLVIHIYIYRSSGNSQWKMDKRGPFSDDLHSELVILNSCVVMLIYHRWNMFGISKDYLPGSEPIVHPLRIPWLVVQFHHLEK